MTNRGVILAAGHMHTAYDCPDCPIKEGPRAGHHRFVDVASTPTDTPGEVLVTSRCKYCHGLIIDCPTIRIF